MLQSHIVDVGGTFVGAAIAAAGEVRFRAVHRRVLALDGRTWRSLAELRRDADHLFTTGQLRPTGSAPAPDDASPGSSSRPLPAA